MPSGMGGVSVFQEVFGLTRLCHPWDWSQHPGGLPPGGVAGAGAALFGGDL